MKTQHTPGPWHADTNVAGDYTQVKAHPNKFICEVDGREKEYQNEANARLIAAAPELLEALADLCYVVGHTYKDSKVFKDARAVIAKATGENINQQF
jgi:hypothetical protein